MYAGTAAAGIVGGKFDGGISGASLIDGYGTANDMGCWIVTESSGECSIEVLGDARSMVEMA